MGKPKAPAGPDYGKLLEMTEANIAANQVMFDEYMGFMRDTTDAQTARADEQYELIRPEIEGQLELSRIQRERYMEQGLPFENEFLEKITNWDTPERQAEAAAQASGDIASSMDAQRENQIRQLESYGIDPSQTRSAALDSRLRTDQAAMQAGAATQARRGVEQQGLALGGEALNIYRGMPAGSIASMGAAGGAAGGALAGTAQAGGMGIAGYQAGSGILGQSQQMLSSGYGTANNIYGNDLAKWETQMANSPLNTMAGLGGMWLGGGGGNPFTANEGAYIHPDASPSKGAIPDDVPGYVSAGEVILPDEVVRYHGLKTLNKLTSEAKEAMGTGIPEGVA